jgi:hypothetical protein
LLIPRQEAIAGDKLTGTPSELPYSSGLSSSTLKNAFRYSNYISLDEKDSVEGYTKSLADIKSLWGKVWFMSPLSIHGDPEKYYIRFEDTDEGGFESLLPPWMEGYLFEGEIHYSSAIKPKLKFYEAGVGVILDVFGSC